MNYSEIKQIFRELKRTSPRDDLTAHIIFTEDSFSKPYPLLSRTYSVSSDDNGFWPNKISRSIFAYCLDVTSDQGVRLDWHMAEEGKVHLEPVRGHQTACGEWVELPINRVYGYCTLLERHLSRKDGLGHGEEEG